MFLIGPTIEETIIGQDSFVAYGGLTKSKEISYGTNPENRVLTSDNKFPGNLLLLAAKKLGKV